MTTGKNILDKAETRNKVFLYSPPRAGGTLIFNVMKSFSDIYPDPKPQTHGYVQQKLPVLATHRDFRDSIMSYWRLQIECDDITNVVPCRIDDPLLQDIIKKWKGCWIPTMNRYKKVYTTGYGQRILWLRYAGFYNDFDFLFNQLEIFLKFKITPEHRSIIYHRCHIKTMKKICSKMKSKNDRHPRTELSGFHIGTGELDTWKILLDERDHEAFTLTLRTELQKWKYMR